ncbi:GNAT family N-acetyltransferase [Actinomadura rudentiformis]|uniref:GNAT family N-acetyltransferase n=1 Tax=Actinomadura rudentiformis TaxID=359158 RepID=A0A6H9YJJ4_9ACTN|nr:GNAT family N-acetyltransferase [Actinomadura rudentiformis]KAB2347023.1 GNAT family N-acetyltransferase [Actinomadura rudentiformis]
MGDLEIREIPESDLERMLDLANMVFHSRTEDDQRERSLWMPRRSERIGAYEGDTLVGQLGALPMKLAVPGAVPDCSAITWVGVLPTHRRRGVLTAMMERMHADAVEAGRPVAALWASQAGIYGRYGFGLANRSLHLEVDSSRPLALRIEADPRPLRLIGRDQAAEVLGPIHARAIARRPGGLVRDAEWWERAILIPAEERQDDYGELRIVVLEGGGYAIYRTRGENEETGAPGIVRLEELEADTPAVEAALWRFLASIDLTGRIQAFSRPVDDLLPLLTVDPDQVVVKGDWGALWLRLIDVPAALRMRSWAVEESLVIEVKDARLPANEGRWRLTGETTGDEPDLTFGVSELGSVYLGGTQVQRLVRAGLVTEHTPGAARRFDAALDVPLAPHTNDDF